MPKNTQKILCLVLSFFSYTNAFAGSPIIWGSPQAKNLQLGGLVSRGTLSLQNLTGSQPTLELYEDPDNGTNKVVLQSTASLGADYTLTLPVDDGANEQVLSTNGSGVLSWSYLGNSVVAYDMSTMAFGSGFGTVTNVKVYGQRRGNQLYVNGSGTAGTVTANPAQIVLPNSLTLDVTNMTQLRNAFGQFKRLKSSAGNGSVYADTIAGIGTYSTADAHSVYFALEAATNAFVVQNVNAFLANGDNFQFEFEVPISEWAAGPAGISSNAFDPTLLSNADATKLGYKTYAHGTTYNGGIAPTVTLSSGGGTLSTVNFSEFIPYQVQSGSWRMKFNLTATLSSFIRTSAVFSINGVTFFSTGADGQAITGWSISGGLYTTYCRAVPTTSTIAIVTVSGTSDEYMFSGDVKLDAKPTWAY